MGDKEWEKGVEVFVKAFECFFTITALMTMPALVKMTRRVLKIELMVMDGLGFNSVTGSASFYLRCLSENMDVCLVHFIQAGSDNY